VFHHWITGLVSAVAGVVALDGKTIRGSCTGNGGAAGVNDLQ